MLRKIKLLSVALVLLLSICGFSILNTNQAKALSYDLQSYYKCGLLMTELLQRNQASNYIIYDGNPVVNGQVQYDIKVKEGFYSTPNHGFGYHLEVIVAGGSNADPNLTKFSTGFSTASCANTFYNASNDMGIYLYNYTGGRWLSMPELTANVAMHLGNSYNARNVGAVVSSEPFNAVPYISGYQNLLFAAVSRGNISTYCSGITDFTNRYFYKEMNAQPNSRGFRTIFRDGTDVGNYYGLHVTTGYQRSNHDNSCFNSPNPSI